MTLRTRFTLAMLTTATMGIILASGLILYSSTQALLAKGKESLRVSCESLLEAYGSFVAENGRVVERIAASPTFGQLLGSSGLSRAIALRAAEAEMTGILQDKGGIEAIEVREGERRILVNPPKALWPATVDATGVFELPDGQWCVLLKEEVPGGGGSISAQVSLSTFGRAGIIPLIAEGGVCSHIALADSGRTVWNGYGEESPPAAFLRAAPSTRDFAEYRRGGIDLIACRIERGGLVFLAEIPRGELFADLARFTRLAAAVAATLLAAGVAAAVLISRRLTVAVKSLAEAARRIGDKDYLIDLDIHSGDEMEVLYVAFKEMGGEIAAFTSDLEGLVAARTAELKLRMAEIELLMVTDPLTGIANRRMAVETLERETARSGRYGNTLGLVLFDIDHFKRVNDVHGHAAGDLVLKGVAGIASAMVRPVDLVARWGGEEFLVVLPETDLAGAVAAAEKIRVAIRERTFGEGLAVTISAGVALFGPPETADAFVARADSAMYESKREGRDRTSRA